MDSGQTCMNCGLPATRQTTERGANTVYYCDTCGTLFYPDGSNLAPLGGGGDDEGQAGEEEDGIPLRDGSRTFDRRLDRVKQFDPKNYEYPMAEVLAEVAPATYKPRSYTWRCDAHFDQGPEGSCVGHAWAHEMVCRPVVIENIDQPFARWVYKTAQRYDAWAGTSYEGTSVIAGAKVLQQRPPRMPEGRGLMQEYRWIFGDMNELLTTVGYFGPVVLGTNWYAGMMDTDADGFIRATGDYMGGHAILIKGVSLKAKAYRLHNSWGTGWGEGGDCWVSFSDLERLLGEQGELCVPVHRKGWG